MTAIVGAGQRLPGASADQCRRPSAEGHPCGAGAGEPRCAASPAQHPAAQHCPVLVPAGGCSAAVGQDSYTQPVRHGRLQHLKVCAKQSAAWRSIGTGHRGRQQCIVGALVNSGG